MNMLSPKKLNSENSLKEEFMVILKETILWIMEVTD